MVELCMQAKYLNSQNWIYMLPVYIYRWLKMCFVMRSFLIIIFVYVKNMICGFKSSWRLCLRDLLPTAKAPRTYILDVTNAKAK